MNVATQQRTPTNTLADPPKKETALMVIKNQIEARGEAFKSALPAHVPTEKFMRIIVTAVASSKDLQGCTQKSIVQECMKAAADGLVLDGREAALVPMNINVGTREKPQYEKQAKYIPMVQGLMKKARNSGEISSIRAVLVHRNDHFEFSQHIHELPVHEVDWFELDKKRGEPVGAYCIIYLKDKDATPIVEVMSRQQIMKIGAGTKNAYQYDPDKGASWGEWWRKTVIRRATKYAPSSTDKEGEAFLRAASRDDDLYDEAEAEAAHVETVATTAAAATAAGEAAPKQRRRRGAGAGATIVEGTTTPTAPAASQAAPQGQQEAEPQSGDDGQPGDGEPAGDGESGAGDASDGDLI